SEAAPRLDTTQTRHGGDFYWKQRRFMDCKSVHAGSIPAVASTFSAPSASVGKAGGLCYRPKCRSIGSFPGSSVVEQPAVNRLVAGSNPARGANKNNHFLKAGQRTKPV